MYKAPTKTQIAKFAKEVQAAFERLGVKLADEHAMYPYEIQTCAGKLLLSPHDDWLAARFDDVALANLKVGSGSLNRFSGKWNHHGLDCVPYFEQSLRELLPVMDDARPPFMMSKDGMIYVHDYATGNVLENSHVWTGVCCDAKDTRSFWFLGRETGERSFTKLKAHDYLEAVEEARLMEASAAVAG